MLKPYASSRLAPPTACLAAAILKILLGREDRCECVCGCVCFNVKKKKSVLLKRKKKIIHKLMFNSALNFWFELNASGCLDFFWNVIYFVRRKIFFFFLCSVYDLHAEFTDCRGFTVYIYLHTHSQNSFEWTISCSFYSFMQLIWFFQCKTTII